MDNCTCSITIDTSPNPVGEAEQDPFCLVHPVEHEVLADRTCSIDGCEGQHKARGWCNKHYQRWQTNGDPLAGRISPGVPMRFFEDHVDDETDDCVLWLYGARHGYGEAWVDGSVVAIHVMSCEKHHGPRPKGMDVCHSCRNRNCFNGRHLRWGTKAENHADKLRDGTDNRGEKNNMVKVTEGQVREIRAATGTNREIAAEYGITPSAVGRVKSRKRWGWL